MARKRNTEVTSRRAASAASKVLRNPRTSKAAKTAPHRHWPRGKTVGNTLECGNTLSHLGAHQTTSWPRSFYD